MKRRIFIVVLVVALVVATTGFKTTSKPEQTSAEKPHLQKDTAQLHFEDDDIDHNFQAMLGLAEFGGASVGEMMYAASRINEKDIKTWSIEMRALASKVEEQAKDALAKNYTETARIKYQRASMYYRAAVMVQRVSNPMYLQDIRKSEECFQQFARLSNPQIERVLIPYEGKFLPGYFFRADASNSMKPTVIMIGGGDTFAEDLYYFSGAPIAATKGYNVIAVDLPGQGTTPFNGLYQTAETEVPVGKIIDYLLSRPDVNPEQIIAYGISFGGYYVCRAGYDNRLAAIAASSPIYNLPLIWSWDDTNKAMKEEALKTNPTVQQMLGNVLDTTPFAMNIERVFFSAGGTNAGMGDVFRKWDKFVVDPMKVTIPILCISAAGDDPVFTKQAEDVYKLFPNPKKQWVFYDAESGADSHSQLNDLKAAAANIYDYFDNVLGR